MMCVAILTREEIACPCLSATTESSVAMFSPPVQKQPHTSVFPEELAQGKPCVTMAAIGGRRGVKNKRWFRFSVNLSDRRNTSGAKRMNAENAANKDVDEHSSTCPSSCWLKHTMILSSWNLINSQCPIHSRPPRPGFEQECLQLQDRRLQLRRGGVGMPHSPGAVEGGRRSGQARAGRHRRGTAARSGERSRRSQGPGESVLGPRTGRPAHLQEHPG